MKPKTFISQPFGLGDIIFTQTIAQMYLDGGHDVYWGVYPQFLSQLQTAYPKIRWVDYRNYNHLLNVQNQMYVDGFLVCPIRWSMEITQTPYTNVMRAKYQMFGLDFKTWKDHAMPIRNMSKEKELFYDVLGIRGGEKYNLINKTFRSDNKGVVNISVDNDYRNVDLEILEEYSLFDWMYTIEQAEEIHTVSTSIFYLLELLNLKNPASLYARKPEELHFKNIESLFTKPYVLNL